MLKISIITAVYNNQKTIKSAIDSVLSQKYPFIEYIVIDGASNDGTLSVLNKNKANIDLLISEVDEGVYDAFNKGIKYATGDVIGFLHADDVYENSDVLTKIASVFQNSDNDALYGDLVYVKSNNLKKVIRYWKAGNYTKKSFYRGWMPPHPTLFIRKSIYNKFGGFNSKYKISADYDLILRFLFTKEIKTSYIQEVLVRMRNGGLSNRSFKNIYIKTSEDYLILKENKVGSFLTVFLKNLRKLNQFL